MFYLIALFKTLYYISDLVPAKVEAGSALRKNVHKLALFMGVVTTTHLISERMGFKDTVPMLLLR